MIALRAIIAAVITLMLGGDFELGKAPEHSSRTPPQLCLG